MTKDSDSPHDGMQVRRALKSLGFEDKAFGDRMDWDKSKTSRMLGQASWRTEELLMASRLLGVDFFASYRNDVSGTTTIYFPVELPTESGIMEEVRKHLLFWLPNEETTNRPPGKVDG